MKILTVALPWVRPTVGTEFSYVLSDNAQVMQSHGIAALALLPQAAQLHLVVPASAISWFDLKLPPVAGNRLRLALDGMLEDRLLDEPSALALALAPQRNAAGQTIVAACDKAWLGAVLALFEQAGRPATRVVPEFAPSGETLPSHRLVVTGSAAQARLHLVDPASCLGVPLSDASVLQGSAGAAFATAPAQAEPEVAAWAEQVLGRTVDVLPAAERLMACSQSLWELAQFDLAQSGSHRLVRRWGSAWQQFVAASAWRPARWGLVALIAANLLGLNAWAWRQDALLADKRAQLRTALLQTFPRVRTVVDAPLQMERELTALRQASGTTSARDVEMLLTAVGSALPQDKPPTALDYADDVLSLEGLALDDAQAQQVLARLSGAGLSAKYEAGRLTVRTVGTI